MTKDNFYWMDHVVLACPDLQEGIDYVEKMTGCIPSYGGKHAQFGTHNALLKIGNLSYFEILAPDRENPKKAPLWMGVELVKEPTLTRFAIRSAVIEAQAQLLSNFSPHHGKLSEGRRALKSGEILSWQLTMPLSHPKITTIPFLIDWQDSKHPSSGLVDECSISSFEVYSADKDRVTLFNHLDIPLLIRDGEEKIELTIDTPNGLVKF